MRMNKCHGRELYKRKDSLTLTTPFSGRRSSGINRELEWPGLCLRGVCGCWLASRQGRERPALMFATLQCFPDQTCPEKGCQYVQQLVLKFGLQGTDPGRGLHLAV